MADQLKWHYGQDIRAVTLYDWAQNSQARVTRVGVNVLVGFLNISESGFIFPNERSFNPSEPKRATVGRSILLRQTFQQFG
jgi:hypothetical protein